MKKIVLLAALLMSNIAFARVAVHDNAGVIPQSQKDALISNGARWPFDLHVLTGAFPSPAALDTAVHRCVTGPNVVCIGLDPVHHKTNVHVGTATGISVDGSVSSAGNSYFRSGDYQGGIEAIASRARALSHTSVTVNGTPVPVNGQPVTVHIDAPSVSSGMSTGWWLFAFFMVALIAVGVWLVRRAIKTAKKVDEDMNDFRNEAFEMSSRNINAAEESEFHRKLKAKLGVKQPMMPAQVATAALPAVQPNVVVQKVSTGPGNISQPAPTTVVHNHYGSPGYGSSYNPTLTGSVMTDVMLANELTRPATVVVPSTPVVVEHEVVRETTPVDSGSSASSWNNDDNGGSSSNWGSSSSSNDDNDSGSSSSSSWDSGSSSSDSGSSSDWGSSDSGSSDSGSSDSGGGGSDW